MQIRRYLQALLDATAEQTAAKAKVDALREVLADEARRRWQAEGAAPTWKADLGQVRLDGTRPEPRLEITDRDTWANHVVMQHPEHAIGQITGIPADRLNDARAALAFAGIEAETIHGSWEVDARWETELLTEHLEVEVNEIHDAAHGAPVQRIGEIVDTAGALASPGEIIELPGVEIRGLDPAPRLVVTLDGDRKRYLLDATEAEAKQLIADLAEPEP